MNYTETLNLYSFQQEYSLSSPLTLAILNELISKKLGSDTLTLTMSYDHTDSIFEWASVNSDPLDLFIERCNDEIIEDNDIAQLRISYYKKIKMNLTYILHHICTVI